MLCRAGRGGDPGRDETERAARLFGAAEALREKVGTRVSWPAWRTLNEREVASVRELLDAETFDTAWMEGRVMAFEEAVAEGVLAGVLLWAKT